jgi:hypothetical protein
MLVRCCQAPDVCLDPLVMLMLMLMMLLLHVCEMIIPWRLRLRSG